MYLSGRACSVEGGGGGSTGGIKKKKPRTSEQLNKKGEGGRARCVKGSGKTQHAGGADRAEHAWGVAGEDGTAPWGVYRYSSVSEPCCLRVVCIHNE